MFIDWFALQKKLYFVPLRTNVHTIGKYTKRTSKFNFLSKQTSQGKDYALLGAGFAKFTADYYCTTLPLWCVYLRLHIKISYAEVKIATHSMSWEIRLLLTPFFLNVLALFKVPRAGSSFQPIYTAAAQSLQARSVGLTSSRGKRCTQGAGTECWKQLKILSRCLASVASCNQ